MSFFEGFMGTMATLFFYFIIGVVMLIITNVSTYFVFAYTSSKAPTADVSTSSAFRAANLSFLIFYAIYAAGRTLSLVLSVDWLFFITFIGAPLFAGDYLAKKHIASDNHIAAMSAAISISISCFIAGIGMFVFNYLFGDRGFLFSFISSIAFFAPGVLILISTKDFNKRY